MPKVSGNPRSILDAGCGRAVFTYELAKKFPEAVVVGVDMDDEQLQLNEIIAGKAGINNIRFKRCDIAELSFNQEFDLVLSVDNLEHIENDQKALQGLSNALADGGKLILHVPSYERRWFFLKFEKNFDVPGHFRPGYRLHELLTMVEQTGLKIIESYYTYGWLENLSNNISYCITRAETKNKCIYGLLFPFLNLLSWLGRNSYPEKGAGILIIAVKKS